MRFGLSAAAAVLAVVLAGQSRSREEYFVKSLPGLSEDARKPTMYAGQLAVDADTDSTLFFWSFEPEYKVTDPKTVLWLNGGPGCSSMDGVFLENGPFRFVEGKDGVQGNPGSWTEYINMIFLDQPFGTGYSPEGPLGFVKELDSAAEYVVKFILEYLRLFPEHQADELYLAGESYAGQYIPYIQRAMSKYVANNPNAPIKPRIAGLILANPWIDSAHQYLSYFDFLKKNKVITDETVLHNLGVYHEMCMKSLQESGEIMPDNGKCNMILTYALQQYDDQKTCFNIYNYKLTDSYASCGMNWPYGVVPMKEYMARSDVQDALHANFGKTWQECSPNVQSHFKAALNPAAVKILPQILQETRVMIMVGDLDVICNVDGLKSMVNSMIWGESSEAATSQQRGFLESEPLQNITLKGTGIADVQRGRNLTMAVVYGGSHMVPVDKLVESRLLVHEFIGIGDYDGSLYYEGQGPGDLISKPDPSNPEAPKGNDDGAAEKDQTEKDKAVQEATRKAYYRAGFTALVVVIVFAFGVLLTMRIRGGAGLSWSEFGRALLHIGRPAKNAAQYVKLDTFVRSGRPEAIVEEDEPEDV